MVEMAKSTDISQVWTPSQKLRKGTADDTDTINSQNQETSESFLLFQRSLVFGMLFLIQKILCKGNSW